MLGGKVYVTLIIGVALFMFGGVSQGFGKTPKGEPLFMQVTAFEFMQVREIEFMEVTEPEFMEITEFEFMAITEFEFMEVTKPEFFVPTRSSSGFTVLGGERKSVEYLMCGPLKGLRLPEKCLYKGR